eukprot:GHVS01001452.1.p1 GENE.GHVS01001452.1~~GHVS01001452.1.p1  ORF type:complete len:639 (+),score=108.94 GHVS01001452.1:115-2031(+)
MSSDCVLPPTVRSLHHFDGVIVSRGNLCKHQHFPTALKLKVGKRPGSSEWTSSDEIVYFELIDLWAIVLNFLENAHEIDIRNVCWSPSSGAYRLTRETLNAAVTVRRLKGGQAFEPVTISTGLLRQTDLTASCFDFLPGWINQFAPFHGNIPNSPNIPRPAVCTLPNNNGPRVYSRLAHIVLPQPKAFFYAMVWDVHEGMRLQNYGETSKCCITLKLVDPSVDIAERPLRSDIDEEASYLLELHAPHIRECFPLFTMGDIVRCHRVAVKDSASRRGGRTVIANSFAPMADTIVWSGDFFCDESEAAGSPIGVLRKDRHKRHTTFDTTDRTAIRRMKRWAHKLLAENIVWCKHHYWHPLRDFTNLSFHCDVVAEVVECGSSDGQWVDHEEQQMGYLVIVTDPSVSVRFGVGRLSAACCEYLQKCSVLPNMDDNNTSSQGLSAGDWIRMRNVRMGADQWRHLETGETIRVLEPGIGCNGAILRLPMWARDVTKTIDEELSRTQSGASATGGDNTNWRSDDGVLEQQQQHRTQQQQQQQQQQHRTQQQQQQQLQEPQEGVEGWYRRRLNEIDDNEISSERPAVVVFEACGDAQFDDIDDPIETATAAVDDNEVNENVVELRTTRSECSSSDMEDGEIRTQT